MDTLEYYKIEKKLLTENEHLGPCVYVFLSTIIEFFSKQLTLVLDDRDGSTIVMAFLPSRPEGAVLHSSGGLQHHGGETYLHCLGAAVSPRSGRVDCISRNTTRSCSRFLYIQFLSITSLKRKMNVNISIIILYHTKS